MNYQKNWMLSVLFIFSFLYINAQEEATLLAKQAETLLEEAITYSEHVGLTAAILKDGAIIWEGGAGFQDQAAKIPAEANMVHRIASINKPLTAAAILQLVEKGKIDLDKPIQNYVPDFPKKKKRTITVRHLLNQTGGIKNYKNFKDGFSFDQFNVKEAVDRFKNRKLGGTPGENYQYATYNYVLLAYIIEKVSGQSYQEYMDHYVWKPAGMHSTAVEYLKMDHPQKSKLYKAEDGKLEADVATNISMKVGGGGIQSTAGDLVRFAKAIFENELISKESLELMLHNPGVRKRGTPYGMGWYLFSKDDRGQIIGHGGAQAGTSTQLVVNLDKKIAVAVISNTRGTNGYVENLAWDLLDRASSSEGLAKPLFKEMNMDRAKKERFLGKYEFGKNNVLEIKLDGDQLYSDLNQFKGLKLYPASDNLIYYRSTSAHFEFEMDDQGNITKTKYVQNGQEFYPAKIEE